ncbi:MAG: c-type cytochrome [Phycisphaerae bacterium]|jgi:cytochrome c5|nr:c-type cytochrome [Phycisphaerae bacterium]
MTFLAPFVSDRQSTKPTRERHNGDPGDASQTSAFQATGSTSLGLRRELIAAGLAFVGVVAGVGLMAGATVLGLWVQRHAAPAREQPLSILSAVPGPMLDSNAYLKGRTLFTMTCAVCHGAQGHGVAGLGKDITQSEFVASLSDGGLIAFLRRGRDANDPYNTTKVPMPPSGGNPQLTDQDMAHLVSFMRGIQDRRRVPADALQAPPVSVAQMVAAPSADEKAAALAAAGGDAELAEYIASGNKLYHSLCVACHGKGGVGMPNNGKALVDNEFVRSLDDDGLLAFVKQGRSPSDPKNTTGIQMPPKGGNPALSDDDILDIIAYLRTLQGGANGAATGGPASN